MPDFLIIISLASVLGAGIALTFATWHTIRLHCHHHRPDKP